VSTSANFISFRSQDKAGAPHSGHINTNSAIDQRNPFPDPEKVPGIKKITINDKQCFSFYVILSFTSLTV